MRKRWDGPTQKLQGSSRQRLWFCVIQSDPANDPITLVKHCTRVQKPARLNVSMTAAETMELQSCELCRGDKRRANVREIGDDLRWPRSGSQEKSESDMTAMLVCL